MINYSKIYETENILDKNKARLSEYSNAEIMDTIEPMEKLNSEYIMPEFTKNLFDNLSLKITKETKKNSIKLPNEYLYHLFKYISNEKGVIYLEDPFIAWKIWKTGYNKTILPYLDLSEFDFSTVSIVGANLAGHSEIMTQEEARRKKMGSLFDKKELKLVNLNGIDFTNSTGKYTNCKGSDLRNTNIGHCICNKDNIIIAELEGCNLEGVNLKGKIFVKKDLYVNLKNTGAIVQLSQFQNSLEEYQNIRECNLVLDCNFTGCKILEFETKKPTGLNICDSLGYPGTYISYNNKTYCGTEKILALINQINKELTESIITTNNYTTQTLLKENNNKKEEINYNNYNIKPYDDGYILEQLEIKLPKEINLLFSKDFINKPIYYKNKKYIGKKEIIRLVLENILENIMQIMKDNNENSNQKTYKL